MPATANAPDGPAADDLVDLAVVASFRRSIGVVIVGLLHSGSSLRSSLTCAGVTGVPLLSQATRM